MACRIGINTDPDERREYWRNRYSSLYGWEILEKCSSKSEAQAAETRLARQCGCESNPGGGGKEYDTWYVYKFSY